MGTVDQTGIDRAIEVLHALSEGKRVRYWVDCVGTGFWSEWAPLETVVATVNELVTGRWETEGEAGMTFMEALAAMDAGETVERSDDNASTGGQVQRKHESGPARYWYRYRERNRDGTWERWSKWIAAGFTSEDVHASDWRIVPAETIRADDRPSPRELAKALEGVAVWVRQLPHTSSESAATISRVESEVIAHRIAERWPSLLRKEDAQ